jgi:hypothetical protein
MRGDGFPPPEISSSARGRLRRSLSRALREVARALRDALMRAPRDAARSLRRRPGTPIAAAGLLALGLASTAAVLSVVETYLVRSLPFPEPDRLHSVEWETDQGERTPRGVDSGRWTTADSGVAAATAWDLDAFTLLGVTLPGGGATGPAAGAASSAVQEQDNRSQSEPRAGEPEVVLGAWVDPGFFDVAGVPLALGRPFSAAETEHGERALAVISHQLWQRRFGGSPQVLGARFDAFMSDRPDEPEQFTVIGVLPESFWWMSPYTQVLAPLAPGPVPRLVRLEPATSAAQAADSFERISRAADPTLPPSFRVRLEPLRQRYVEGLAPLLRALVLATLFVLAVATGNALLLVLVRAASRERELAVHAALAGGWGSAARLLIGEAMLICLAAGVAGLALGRITLQLVAPHLEQQLGRTPPGGAEAVTIGATALAGVAAATFLATLLLSLLPIWLLRRRDLSSVLRGAAASATGHRGTRRMRDLVLSAEIAFTLALLAAGGLAVRSALELERRALGHARTGVLTGGVGLRLGSYPSPEEQLAFAERLLERLHGVPGAKRAAIAGTVVLGGMTAQRVIAEPAPGNSSSALAGGGRSGSSRSGPAPVPPAMRRSPVEPEEPQRGGEALLSTSEAGVRTVSPGYFATLGVTVRSGRDFGRADGPDAPRVAIVSAELARELWPPDGDRAAIGRRLRLAGRRDAPPLTGDEPEAARPWLTVVGVAAPVRETVLGEELPEVYVPFAQSPSRWIGMAIATDLEPESLVPALAAELLRLDPTLPLYRPSSIERRLAEERAPSRFLATLLGGFSVFALAVGTAGVYGVIARGVAQRLREVAIRLSLGADRGRILRMFLAETSALLVAGLGAGAVAGALLVRVLASRLHGAAGGGLSTWLTVTALLIGSSLLATWLPARRAVAEDPASLLRSE